MPTNEAARINRIDMTFEITVVFRYLPLSPKLVNIAELINIKGVKQTVTHTICIKGTHGSHLSVSKSEIISEDKGNIKETIKKTIKATIDTIFLTTDKNLSLSSCILDRAGNITPLMVLAALSIIIVGIS
jgi:hypothetical protein